MAYKLVVVTGAEKEIRDALKWYEEQQKGLEKRFNQELQTVLSEILTDPDLFQKRYRNIRIRFMRKFKYGVHYEVREDLIIVMAVLHTSRKPRT